MKYEVVNFDDAFIIADIHLGVRNNSLMWHENILDYFKNFLIPLVKKHKTDHSVLFILGDLFDDRKSVSIDTMNLGADIVEELTSILPVYVILGNHDMFKKSDGKINSLRMFEMCPNITIIKEPTVFTKTISRGVEADFLMLPHLGDVEKETRVVKDFCNEFKEHFSKEYPGLVFAHTDIAGLKYDNNKNINTGLQVNSKVPLKIYSGHIHKRQDTSKVVYVGSPYHLRRSDIGNEKGVYRIFFNDFKTKFYKNNHSPEFKRVFYDAIIDLPLKTIKKLLHNNYIDIIINESDLNDLNVNDLFQSLEYCQAKKIEIIVNRNIENSLEYDEETFKELTLEELIESNIEALNIDDHAKKELLKLYSYYNNLVKEEFDL